VKNSFACSNQGTKPEHRSKGASIDYRCADGRCWLSARGVTILNDCSVYSSETEVRNRIQSWKTHGTFRQLNDRKLLVVFVSAKSGELQLYSQI
jgi:hypothetical protein